MNLEELKRQFDEVNRKFYEVDTMSQEIVDTVNVRPCTFNPHETLILPVSFQ